MGKAQDVLMSLVRNCVTKAQHFWAHREGSGAEWLQQPSFSGGCIPEKPWGGVWARWPLAMGTDWLVSR